MTRLLPLSYAFSLLIIPSSFSMEKDKVGGEEILQDESLSNEAMSTYLEIIAQLTDFKNIPQVPLSGAACAALIQEVAITNSNLPLLLAWAEKLESANPELRLQEFLFRKAPKRKGLVHLDLLNWWLDCQAEIKALIALGKEAQELFNLEEPIFLLQNIWQNLVQIEQSEDFLSIALTALALELKDALLFGTTNPVEPDTLFFITKKGDLLHGTPLLFYRLPLTEAEAAQEDHGDYINFIKLRDYYRKLLGWVNDMKSSDTFPDEDSHYHYRHLKELLDRSSVAIPGKLELTTQTAKQSDAEITKKLFRCIHRNPFSILKAVKVVVEGADVDAPHTGGKSAIEVAFKRNPLLAYELTHYSDKRPLSDLFKRLKEQYNPRNGGMIPSVEPLTYIKNARGDECAFGLLNFVRPRCLTGLVPGVASTADSVFYFHSTGIQTLAIRTCNHCGTSKIKLLMCKRCMQARYCDADCQKKDWPSHKQHCNPS